jgi:hypothetical protein
MEYSAVRHICVGVWFNRSLDERLLLMYESYFDNSGDRASIIVAGWAASAEKWLSFEDGWRKHLALYNLPYFHMKEFGKNGVFAHAWGDDRQRYCDFLQGCAAIIKKHVNFGISRGVFLDEYDAANLECGIKFKVGPAYSTCGALAASRAQKRGISADFEAAYIRHHFDDPGKNKGKAELDRLFESMGLPTNPQFEKGEKDKKPIPLQAADFLAWEHRYLLGQFDEFGPLAPDDMHRSLRHLNSIPNDSQMLAGKENIVAFAHNPRSLC